MYQLETNVKILFRYSPYILLSVFIFLNILLFWLQAFLYLPLALGFLVGTVIFLSSPFDIFSINFIYNNIKLYKIGYILIFIFLGAAVTTLRDISYTKPIEFYMLTALAFAIITIVSQGNRLSSLWVFTVTCLALIVFLSQQLVFSRGYGGPDSYYHVSQVVRPIVDFGFVPKGTTYTAFPLSHLIAAELSIIVDIRPRYVYYYLLSFVLIIGAIWMYLFSRRILWTNTWGYDSKHLIKVTVLIYFGSDFVIQQANQGFHLVYTAIFILITISIIYRIIMGGTNIGGELYSKYVLLLLIIILALNITHHYSVGILLILISSFMILSNSFRKVGRIFLLICIVTLMHWTLTAGAYGLPFVITQILTALSGVGTSPPQTATQQPLFQIVYSTLAASFLFALFQTGSLKSLTMKSALREKSIPLLSFTLFGLMGIGVLTAFSAFSPHRMLFFSQAIFIPVFFIVGAKYIFNNNTIIYVSIIVCIISFFAMSGFAASIDTSPAGNEVPHNKVFETPEESKAVSWFEGNEDDYNQVYASRSFVDFKSGTVMFRSHLESSNIRAEPIPIDGNKLNNTRLKPDTAFLFTDFDMTIGYRTSLDESRRFGEGEYHLLDEDNAREINQNNLVFSSGSVRIYVGRDDSPD